MSTRSIVGYKENGTYNIVYVHSDGYFDGVGKTLLDHYDSLEDAKSIVSLGDISVLTYDEIIAYHRDRNEDWEDVKPDVIDEEEMNIYEYATNRGAEYIYIYDAETDRWNSTEV